MVKYCILLFVCISLVNGGEVVPLPENVMRGIAITPDGPLTLKDYALSIQLDEAINIGADWIFVNAYVSQWNGTSSKVFKGPQTPLDSVLKSFVSEAKAKGLKVLLKPLIIPLDGSSWLLLDPEYPNDWFESYTDILLSYCELLPELDALSIGLELLSLTMHPKYHDDWNNLIQQVREHTDAKLTYSSLFELEVFGISFWNQLDWIGIDEYVPVATEDNPFPSVEEMTETISDYFTMVSNFRMAQNLTSKPVVITEMGIYSYTNATFVPSLFPPGLKTCNGSYYGNYTTQQVYFEAQFAAIQQHLDLITGVFMYQ